MPIPIRNRHTFTPFLTLIEDTETGKITAELDFGDSWNASDVLMNDRYDHPIDYDDPCVVAACEALDAYLKAHPALTAKAVIRPAKED